MGKYKLNSSLSLLYLKYFFFVWHCCIYSLLSIIRFVAFAVQNLPEPRAVQFWTWNQFQEFVFCCLEATIWAIEHWLFWAGNQLQRCDICHAETNRPHLEAADLEWKPAPGMRSQLYRNHHLSRYSELEKSLMYVTSDFQKQPETLVSLYSELEINFRNVDSVTQEPLPEQLGSGYFELETSSRDF